MSHKARKTETKRESKRERYSKRESRGKNRRPRRKQSKVSCLHRLFIHFYVLLSHCLIGDKPRRACGGREDRSVLLLIHLVPFLSHRSSALLSLILSASGRKLRNQNGERRRARTRMRNDGKERELLRERELASSPAEEEEREMKIREGAEGLDRRNVSPSS